MLRRSSGVGRIQQAGDHILGPGSFCVARSLPHTCGEWELKKKKKKKRGRWGYVWKTSEVLMPEALTSTLTELKFYSALTQPTLWKGELT